MNDAPHMDVAVVGVGRMGRYHARAYKALPGARLVAVVDANPARAQEVAREFACDACTSVDQLLEKYLQIKAVSVAVPTRYHFPAAASLLERGVACLVEKPLASTSLEARRIADLAKLKGVTLQVGHTERFNPAVRAVAALKLRPGFMEVIRVSPMSFRSLDIGVVMDMMIHDLDIVLNFAASPIARLEASGVAVLGRHEDVASTRITFESGCVANITASRLALKTERKLRLFSEQAYVSLDYQARTGVIISKTDNLKNLEDVQTRIAAGEDLSQLEYLKLVNVKQLDMGRDSDSTPAGSTPANTDPLTAELSSFLSAVRTGAKPQVTGEDGVAAVDAAERVVAAVSSK